MRLASTMTHKPLATKRRPRRRVAVKQTRVRGARLRPAEHGHHGADLTKSPVDGFRRSATIVRCNGSADRRGGGVLHRYPPLRWPPMRQSR